MIYKTKVKYKGVYYDAGVEVPVEDKAAEAKAMAEKKEKGKAEK